MHDHASKWIFFPGLPENCVIHAIMRMTVFIFALVATMTKGEIVEIELDDKDGGLYYEIYYLDSGGRRIEIYVDAATGQILKGKTDD